MKKVRVFLAASALLLVTAGVFAGKANHHKAVSVAYYFTGTGYYSILDNLDNSATPSTIDSYPIYAAPSTSQPLHLQ